MRLFRAQLAKHRRWFAGVIVFEPRNRGLRVRCPVPRWEFRRCSGWSRHRLGPVGRGRFGRVLYAVSLGRVYWSAARVGLVGRGRKEVTSALAAVLAATLGIAAGDLTAIGGMRLPADPEIPLNPSADAMAELTLEARRLTAEQVEVVRYR